MIDRYKVEKKCWKNRLENQIVSDRHDVKARLFQKFFSFSFCFFFFTLLWKIFKITSFAKYSRQSNIHIYNISCIYKIVNILVYVIKNYYISQENREQRKEGKNFRKEISGTKKGELERGGGILRSPSLGSRRGDNRDE